MTLFTNPNFIDHILKSQGVHPFINEKQYTTMQTFIQLETRHLIETAIKFMSKDRRDTISLDDIVQAAKHLNHSQMKLASNPDYSLSNQHINKDKTYQSPEQLLKEQAPFIVNYSVQHPRLRGRWIYIKNKIPQTNNNLRLKSLSQITASKEHQIAEKKKHMHVIKDNPYSLLTKQQHEYFIQIVQIIQANVSTKAEFRIEGDLNGLLPFFLKYLGEKALNETGVQFLLRLLDNKYIWTSAEYYLKKILNILIAYKGPSSYQAGIKIAQLVQRFCNKYPILRDIYVGYDDQSYSTILKKIAFQLYLGIAMEINDSVLIKLKEESESSNLMANLCMRALLSHSSQLKLFKDYLVKKMNTFVFWHPCPQLKNDPYLRMF